MCVSHHHCSFLAKQDDDEIILQIAYNIYQLLIHSSTRDAVMKTGTVDQMAMWELVLKPILTIYRGP